MTKVLDDFCNKCGACCKLFNLTIKITDELRDFYNTIWGEFVDSPDLYIKIRDDNKMDIIFGIRCRSFDTKKNKCKIYENRPKTCRDYYCGNARKRYEIG